MGRLSDNLSYRVKNTFVEIGPSGGEECANPTRARRAWSDVRDVQNQKVAVSNPDVKPRSGNALEVPIPKGVGSAAFVPPDTPSPFLHPAKSEMDVIPPFAGMGFGAEMGLPPAYTEDLPEGADAYVLAQQMGFEGQDLQGFYGVPTAMMYDPSSGTYHAMGGWCMPLDGIVPQGTGQAEAERCADLPLDGLMDAQGVAQFVDGSVLELQQDTTWSAEAGVAPQAGEPQGPVPEMLTESPDVGTQLTSQLMDTNQDADSGDNGQTGTSWRGKGGRGGGRQAQLQHELPSIETGTGGADTVANVPTSNSNNNPSANFDGQDVEGGDGTQTVLPGYTTVMLRNIPNKYTREMLVKQLSQEFRGRFDFVYLPIDFKNRCNVGYGFINFRTTEACEEFVTKFDGVDVRKCLPGLNSRKVAEVTPARVQGREENVRRLRNGPVMNELVHHPEWMPLLLGEDGEEKPFPLPDQPCPAVKLRKRQTGREEHSGSGRGW